MRCIDVWSFVVLLYRLPMSKPWGGCEDDVEGKEEGTDEEAGEDDAGGDCAGCEEGEVEFLDG